MTTWSVIWDPPAIAKASRFLEDDPDGLAHAMNTADRLAGDPRPPDSIAYGSEDLRRLHVGRYRVLYEIDRENLTVTVIHLGRIA